MLVIEKKENRHWGYAMVRPRNEKSVALKMAAAGMPYYLPLITNHDLNKHKKDKPSVPMFCGYIFVCLTADERRELSRENAVRRIFLFESYEEENLIRELNVVRTCEQLSKERQLIVNPGLVPGDCVLCKAGPLKGEYVIVQKRSDEVSFIVNWNCFGRSCEIRYPANALAGNGV